MGRGTVDKQGRGHLNGGGGERENLGRTHRKVTYEEHLEECLPFSYRTVTTFLRMKARARIYRVKLKELNMSWKGIYTLSSRHEKEF